MSTASQFGGGSRIATSLVGTPLTSATISNVAAAAAATAALSGAMTAATLKTALSVSGRGRLNWLGIYTNDATSRTLRVKVTIDGTVIRDFTSAAIASSGSGYAAVGAGHYAGDSSLLFQPIDFNVSLLVEIASSLTETDKITTAWNYEVHR